MTTVRGVLCAALVGLLMSVTATALADLAPEPGYSLPSDNQFDRTWPCEPNQQEGEDCVTGDDEEGTCVDDTVKCTSPNFTPTYCLVCEPNCAVAMVGWSGSSGGFGLGALLAVSLGLFGLRRRRYPRRQR